MNGAHELAARSTPQPERAFSELGSNGDDRDRADLVRLGKIPVLKRTFGFMSILGFSCTTLITWEATLIIFQSGFENGGPAGIVYGYLAVWLGTLSIYASLCELASMAPTAAGQYHWASMLAPRSSQKFFSYITGWLTVAGWQASMASVVYLSATLVQGLITFTNPSYTAEPWHAVLLCWMVIIFSISINAFVSSFLAKFEGLILVLHILGFFAVMLPLVTLGKHQDKANVFGRFLNEGPMPTQGLSVLVGMVGSVFIFVGADGAVHMSEEIKNAAVTVPRSVLATVLINGSLGFGMIMATLFSLDDVEAALESPTEFPFMEIFFQATQSIAGAAVMASIITVMQLCTAVAVLASASRMSWSFARDRGLPAWKTLSKVHPQTTIPIWAVGFTAMISVLLSLIVLGSSTAFHNLVTLAVAGLYISYLTAASLLLYRRCTGGIQSTAKAPSKIVNNPETQLTWGPWHIPGYLGIAINTFACLYMTLILFFSFWPTELPATGENMNYTILVLGGWILFSVVYYFTWARKEYTGPVIQVDQWNNGK